MLTARQKTMFLMSRGRGIANSLTARFRLSLHKSIHRPANRTTHKVLLPYKRFGKIRNLTLSKVLFITCAYYKRQHQNTRY